MKSGRSERRPTAFLQEPSQELHPQLSPDGNHIAYQSNESGTPEIYVRYFPSGRNKVRASINGGTSPRWSPDGQVFYVNDNTLMAVAMDIVDGVREIKKPERLFNAEEVGGRLLGEYLEPAYDVAKNGERFVVIQRRFNSTITMVEN